MRSVLQHMSENLLNYLKSKKFSNNLYVESSYKNNYGNVGIIQSVHLLQKIA